MPFTEPHCLKEEILTIIMTQILIRSHSTIFSNRTRGRLANSPRSTGWAPLL